VLTRPAALSDDDVMAEVAAGWGVTLDSVEYLAVGFGSHHWRAAGDGRRWFVTVDDLDARRWSADETCDGSFARLDAAISTARWLHDRGLGFVVAPEPARDGRVLRRRGGFALALYPHVDGRTHPFGAYPTAADRHAVLDLVVELHAVAPDGPTRTDDLSLQNRVDLARALDDLDRPWGTGPYAEPAREVLAASAPAVRHKLQAYDRLADVARSQPGRMVVTHGEPHAANTMLTPSGWVLVDWDTALVAPPERDLWAMAGEDPAVLDAYAAASGRTVEPDAIELYRLGWDLAEVAIYTALLRRPHEPSEDVDKSWGHLQGYLEQLAAE
jgi:spectinomycin phosphotransferase/16S rRNA (guanine(1405)-N(7))-methyltransferase